MLKTGLMIIMSQYYTTYKNIGILKIPVETVVMQGVPQPVQKPEEEIECQEPCDPQVGCPNCADYWARMEHEGFWENGKWTDKGMKEMTK
jgi:hypothetical protein